VKEMRSLKIVFQKIRQTINSALYAGFYQIISYLLFLIFRLLFHVRIYGQEKPILWRKQHKLPFLVAACHKSYLDPGFLPVAFGSSPENRLICLAKDELRIFFQFIPFSSRFMIYINRDKPGIGAIKKAISSVKDGNNLAIFPEGTTISQNKKTYGGIIEIIKKVKELTNEEIPIFPLNIKTSGFPYGKPKGKFYWYLLRKVKVELRIGNPIFYRDLEEAVGKKKLANKEKRTLMVEELLRRIDQI
jgi:1-acyl-sn-glycerol-3-phosphate acyltransferase